MATHTRARLWLTTLALASITALAAAPLACGSDSGADATIGDDGGAASDDGGLNGDGGVNALCTASAPGAACNANGDCCSNLCLGNQCVASVSQCAAVGATCATNTDCCNGACVNGACGATQCVSIGDACPTAGNVCCTDHCDNGECAPVTANPTCTTANNACAKSADCCSGLCTGGFCNPASSFCLQTNEICFNGADCCGGTCTSPNGSAVSPTNPGTCGQPPTSGGVNCKGVDGTLCDPSQVGCSGGCCSALCAPFGPTGIAVCQQAQGCRVEGDLCHVDGDCCGGESPDAGILGGGLVQCSTSVNGGTIGVCMTPTSKGGGSGGVCVPEGDVCHYNGAGYACSVSAKRSDCCGPQKPPFLACQLDKLGVPRCLAYGLDDGGMCKQSGDACATAGDCCDGRPCVPNTQGQLTCASAACIPTSGTCTSSADCCSGVTCVIPPGSLSGTCAAIPPPPGSDAGSGSSHDGGQGCALYGQSCAALGCCLGTYCGNGVCTVVK